MDEAGKSGNPESAQAQEPQRRVFISYASHDAAVAQKVCLALETAGFACWIAPRNPALLLFKSQLMFDKLDGDPRYKALLKKMNLPE
jgi:hypothetical protein